MNRTMLIDATHVEETRVAVVDGHRLVDFDYESKVRKQLKGGIFLAKVTRVEPSLQAAFVNFGGNRHGFLPFSEIHPDYFRIPVADREALLAAQAAELEEHDNADDEDGHGEETVGRDESAEDSEEDEEEDDYVIEVGGEDKPGSDDENEGEEIALLAQPDDADDEEEDGDDGDDVDEDDGEEPFHAAHDHDDEDDFIAPGNELSDDESEINGNNAAGEETHQGNHGETPRRERGGRDRNRGRGRGRGRGRDGGGGASAGAGAGKGGGGRRSESRTKRVEMIGGDGIESDRPFRYNLRRQYKIQEVIKRGQIMLIQVAKEERGNKGAAVTSYLSLPGRYCVLMPNSPRGGGVSRKIANFQDRKRMKEVLSDLQVPEGMSVILRTAGLEREKVEIKRDLDYLTRLWNTIREDTLKSSAPAMIYEEGNLIKRAIRDLYGREIEEVHVAGEEGYKTARDFMKMLMPSHVKNVKEYKELKVPLFHKYKVESQISDIGKPSVTLKSGGYLVINPTEALVSIDVNSGRATRERHIEETALKTNMEAAEEVARQLRLRDLGGLIVIDFIDMEDRRNNRKVENKLKQALSNDRARIQVGRISSFGLMELSRQRLNPSLTEAQFEKCEHCQGVGSVRTPDFAAISFLRALEDEGIKGRAAEIIATLPDAVALYILNHKSQMLADIEARYGVRVHIRTSDDMPRSEFTIEIMKKASAAAGAVVDADDEDVDGTDTREEGDEERVVPAADGEDADGRARRRRRGRRGGRRRTGRERELEGAPDSEDRNNNEDAEIADQDGEGGFNEDAEGDDEGSNTSSNRQPRQPREASETDEEGAQRRRRRRGGRGRRGGKGRNGGERDDQAPRDTEGNGPRREASEQPQPSQQPQMSAPEMRSNPPPVNDAPLRAPPRNEPAAPPPPRDYEKVNEAPTEKKKGWWNKLSK